MEPTQAPQPLPRWASALLTRRFACAALLFLMQTAVVWLALLFAGIPLLGTLAVAIGTALNLLAPAVVAVVTIGGGPMFALQCAALASLGIFVASQWQLPLAITSLALYGVAPILGAWAICAPTGGMQRSASRLLWLLSLGGAGALLAAAAAEQTTAAEVSARIVRSMFANAAPPNDAEAAAAVAAAQQMLAQILPGLLVAGVWISWWIDVLLARSFAIRHGFFHGDRTPASELRFSPALGIAFALSLAGLQLAEGGLRFWAANASVVLGAAIAADGVMLAHGFFVARGMHFALWTMYLLLLLSSAMILPFLLLGLVDLWTDLRKRFRSSSNGG